MLPECARHCRDTIIMIYRYINICWYLVIIPSEQEHSGNEYTVSRSRHGG